MNVKKNTSPSDDDIFTEFPINMDSGIKGYILKIYN